MEYIITIKPNWNQRQPISFTINLSNEQIGGIILFRNLYIDNRLEERDPDPYEIISIKETTGTVDLHRLQQSTDLLGGSTYNTDLLNILKYDNPKQNGYEIIYRFMVGRHEKEWRELPLPASEEVDRVVTQNGLGLQSRYFGIFVSKRDVIFKQFNTAEYIQGFMSMASWLGEDYSPYILYLFDGKVMVKIA